ncbi:T9SS type A sorting domain-containing protein [Dyadobacter luticola]|nr:T9SS type A sorting domain-containing protein [Dyadobacter luticola]
MRFILYCAVCFACCQSVLAQDNAPDPPEKVAADALFAMTQADYYTNLLVNDRVPYEGDCSGVVCKQGGLPVTLIKFEGERIDDANVALTWETSEETNNDYFEVERTLNPSRGFITVAKVKGAGSTATLHSYQQQDFNDYPVYTYYRLKQVDFDGTIQYSAIISIKASDAALTVTALPNPGQSKHIGFKITGLKATERFTTVIYNVQGAVVFSDPTPQTDSGEQIVRPKLQDIPPGKYSIKIKSADRQATTSFVVIP